MKIILLVLLTGITSNHAQGIQLCTTPDYKYGSCMPIRNCNSMVEYLLAKENFTLAERQFLNKYQCGYVNKSPLICCPNHGIIVSGLDSSRKVETPITENVKDHRNFRLLPIECGINLKMDTDRILGGNKTGVFEFPWMALLSYQTGSGPVFKCGGTIINDRYILTAAHCIIANSLFGVRLGEHSIKNTTECEEDEDDNGKNVTVCADPVQDFYIEEAIVHNNYNKPHGAANDIALLRLARPIRMSNSIRPICLPVEKDVVETINYSSKYIVTGWGATNTSDSSDELLQTKVAAFPLNDCQRTYEDLKYTITESQFCASSIGGSDSCNGDSGGPIKITGIMNGKTRYIQSGIVSLGPKPCAKKDVPGVYTKVDSYVNWILDQMTD